MLVIIVDNEIHQKIDLNREVSADSVVLSDSAWVSIADFRNFDVHLVSPIGIS